MTTFFSSATPVSVSDNAEVLDMDILTEKADPTAFQESSADTASLAPVNLYTVGYEKAEQHRGNALALENLLNRVLRGYLVEERNDDARRLHHHKQIDGQILDLEKEIEAARTGIRKINETQLPDLHTAIEQLDDEILQIRKDEAAGLRDPSHRDRLQLRLYGGLLGLLTLFVYLFYVSAFYSAFYRDLAGELQTAGPEKQASVLAAIFAKTAFQTFDFHWFGPLLLFAFGGMLHALLANRTLIGRLLLVALLLVVACTDGLIAFFIEDKNHELKVLMGLANTDDHTWLTSPVFWLVIAMGFVAALVWSGLLHTWMHEYSKKDVAQLVALEIQHRLDKQQILRKQIAELQVSLADLEGQIVRCQLDIKALQDSRQAVVFSPAELEKYVTDFYDGWLTYVNNRMSNDTPLRDACNEVLKAFYVRHLNGE